ncbi:hypothetical protein FAI40_03765 [Acetobacteraceae bacterium]|nr:hypothetical protein FAI40_03765 [Acetobacteraceae bacterium]
MNHLTFAEKLTAKSPWLVPLLLLAWAILLRFPNFGSPIVDADQNWFLYVGGQMLHGSLPYVDLWDRKPIGLFLLYAPFNFFGEYRFWAMELGATFFAWATSCLIYRIAAPLTSRIAGFLAGLIYFPFLNSFTGYSAREAVFYNLFVLGAFALVLFRLDKLKENPALLLRIGMEAMLLFGLALDLKTSVVFEGIYLGCVLLFFCWKSQKSIVKLFGFCTLWVSCALLPTVLSALFYVFIGHWNDWYFANVISFFQQGQSRPIEPILRWCIVMAFSLIIILLANQNLRKTNASKIKRESLLFIAGWAFAATLIIAIVGASKRFTIPYFPILCLLFAFLWEVERIGKIIAGCTFIIICLIGLYTFNLHITSAEDLNRYYARKLLMTEHPGCLLEYGEEEIQDITETTATCRLTRYPYPNHLGEPREQGALGLKSELDEIKHIIAQQPRYISISFPILKPEEGTPPAILEQYAYLTNVLKAHYHLARTEKFNAAGKGLYEHN